MKNKLARLFVVLLASAFLMLSFDSFCQTGRLKAKILEQATKQPVSGATVSLKGTAFNATTDTSGTVSINGIPEGNYRLTITMIGFQPKEINDILITPGKVYDLEAELLQAVSSLKEVKVRAVRGENNLMMPVSTYVFSREEIFRNPGSQGDIFRVIGILPGVTSSGGQFSAISVRGQGVKDNVYVVDDIPMQEVSHLEGQGGFNDPNGGRFSIFAPRTIDNAVFQGGGFSAQYGRKGSAYLGLGIKEGNTETPSFSGQFDLLGGTLIYDGPSYAIKNTSVFATARYQNFSLLEKVVGLKNIGLPSYGDYMIKTITQLGQKNKLEVLAMYNPENYTKNVADVAQSDKVEDVSIGNSSNNKLLFGLNLRTLTSKNSYWKNILYYRTLNNIGTFGTTTPKVNPDGTFASKQNIPNEPDLTSIKNNQREIGYRSVFTEHFKSLTLIAGTDISRVDVNYAKILKHTDTLYSFTTHDPRPSPAQHYLVIQPSQFNSVFKNAAYNASAYIDLSFQLLKNLTLNPGGRFDYTGFSSEYTIAPRISGSLALTGQSSLNFATGIYYQDPMLTNVADQPSGHKLKAERTIQYILGYKNYFTNDLKLVIETWYKQLDHLVVQAFSGQSLLNNNGTGYAYGADFNLTKRLTEKFYGQVGYSYMQSRRDDHDGQGVYNFTYSQPHIFSLLGSYKPDNRWVFSAKFRYATGRPKDTYTVYDNVFNDPNLIRYAEELKGKNAARLNDFISLDVRSDYRIQLKKTAFTFFIDIVDALNRNNQSDEVFQPITGRTYYDGLGIFPSFGIRIEL
ncbi:MAG: TonB-dependent receptor [Mucilaginibacter sp.]|nr:TonB-dependent receptor [Mucilaginibacter sp.]